MQKKPRASLRGALLFPAVRDFLDIASHDTVTRTLSRLAREGVVRRVGHGIYDVPRVSTLLNKPVPPDPFQVAVAMARRVGEEIAPSEASTANALDIKIFASGENSDSTQVPAKTVYRTNGSKVRKAKVGNHTIELRPTAARYFPDNDGEGVMQGLRFVGEGNVSGAMVERIRRILTGAQKADLRRKISDAPVWMRPHLFRIAESTEGPV